jgi:hypothetical protein
VFDEKLSSLNKQQFWLSSANDPEISDDLYPTPFNDDRIH